MSIQIQLRRGTATQHTTFTGVLGEATVNTTNNSLHVHDGTTAGGFELARKDLSNVASIPNSKLANSTISGIALGSNLAALTIGTGLSGTSYNGSTAVTIALANTAVTAGTYGSSTAVPVITVDAQGRITLATTAAISGALTFTGDVTGTGTTGTSTTLTLANSGVTAGTYSYVTVNAKGLVTSATQATTTNIAEGTNLYYTQARFDTAFGAKSTTNLTEGTNLYYTQNRFDSAFGAKSTTNLTEGTNLYYTDARARAAHSAGTGISYNSTTGVISTSQDISASGSPTFAALTTTGNANVGGALVVTGNLTVNGTTEYLNSVTVQIADKNIELGSVASPTDTTANGGGITLKGSTDKTINWVSSTAAWTLSEHLALAAGKTAIFNGSTSGTVTLQVPAVAGSTTITLPATTGTVVTTGDTGTVTSAMIADGTIVNADISASAAIAVSKISGLASSATTDTTNAANISSGTLSASRLPAFSGDASTSAGSSVLTLANTAVTAGSYGSATAVPIITVDSKGRITSASTATISGALTFTGDVTGTGTTGSSTSLTLANTGVTAGTYSYVTVNAKGLVTAATQATTTNIAEGTNLYYTDARVRAAVGINNGLTYNSANGSLGVSSTLNPSRAYVMTATNLVAGAAGADYTFTGDVAGADPTINASVGDVLVFNVNAPGHPLLIKTVAGSGTTNQVTQGVTNAGTTNGTLVWNTAGITPGTYYYHCQYHPDDGGTIILTAPTFNVGSDASTVNIGKSGGTVNIPANLAVTGSISGNISTATALATGRTISLTGDVTYTSGSFDGTGNVTGTATLANTGVTASSYGSSTSVPVITVDSKGRITSASTASISGAITISGDATGTGTTGETTAITLATVNSNIGSFGSSTQIPTITVNAKGLVTAVSTTAVSIPSGALTFTGDVTGTGITGSSTALTLANSGVTAGTYTKITVDAKGRATAGASATTSDISEGTNLYYTTARANTDFDTRLALKSTTNLAEGTNLYYTSSRFDSAFSGKTTDNLTEGANLYFTNARARSALTVSGSLSYNSTTGALSYTTPSTSGITEGTNLYYTDARARASNSAGTGISYNSTTGVIAVDTSVISTKSYVDTSVASLVNSAPATLDTLSEVATALGNDPNLATTLTTLIGTKLATADFTSTANTWLGTKSTSNLTEGTNQYFTTARARSSISVGGSLSYNSTTGVLSYTTPTTDGITEGSANLFYSNARVNSAFDTRLALKSTTDLAEGTNKYYTDARARAAISVSGNGSYNSTTGVITIIGGGGATFGGTLATLSDVSISSPVAQQVLKYNGSAWVNANSDAAVASAVFAPQAQSDLGVVTDSVIGISEDLGTVAQLAYFVYDMGQLRLDGIVSLNNLDQSVKSDYISYSIIFGF